MADTDDYVDVYENGLPRLSDRETGDYTAADEAALVRFTDLLALTLETLWALRNARKGQQ